MAKLFHSTEDYLRGQERKHEIYSMRSLKSVGYLATTLLAVCFVVLFNNLPLWAALIMVIPTGAYVLMVSYYTLLSHSQAERIALRYRLGRAGELRVLEVLRTLDDRYSIFYGGKISKGNIDFIVLRGNILFNIEVKNHAGAIMYDGYEMLRDEKPFLEHGLLGQVHANERQLRTVMRFLPNMSRLHIVSVLVFSNPRAFVETVGNAQGVHVTHVRLLRGFIESHFTRRA